MSHCRAKSSGSKTNEVAARGEMGRLPSHFFCGLADDPGRATWFDEPRYLGSRVIAWAWGCHILSSMPRWGRDRRVLSLLPPAKSEFAARELRSVAERTKQTTVRFEDEPRCVELAVQVGYARHL